jgi:hypothetical protein
LIHPLSAVVSSNNNNNNNNNNTETAENWYSHIPKPVTEHEDITVLWNQGIERFWQTGLT